MSCMRPSLCGLLALVMLLSGARAEDASAKKEQLHIPAEFFPVRLDNSRPTGVRAGGKWHWVVTTCERHGWGRMLSSTLLSGVGANLDIASLSLSWCHTHTDSLPSLLYNLRHHPFINVLLMSKALQDQAPQNPTHRLIFTWLSIPFMLGAPDLPLIVTEDDILWSPTANQQLLQAIANMEKVVAHKDEPYLLSLYAPGTVPKNLNDNTTSVEVYQPENETLTSDEMRLQAFYHFGSQGFFFSPGMTQNIEEVMLKVMYNSTESWDIDGGQDMIIKRLVEIRWKCMEKGSGCYFYSTRPSVLQHIGTSSATFNNNGLNTRFHGATDFPVKVKWSGFDDVELWK